MYDKSCFLIDVGICIGISYLIGTVIAAVILIPFLYRLFNAK